MTQPDTRTLDVPGASLVYDVRPSSGEQRFPTLILAASPMDAGAFGTLASYFTDRTVVTYDPRGTGRGVRTDTTIESTPRLHADDLDDATPEPPPGDNWLVWSANELGGMDDPEYQPELEPVPVSTRRKTSASTAGLIAPGHSYAWASPTAPRMLLRSLLGEEGAERAGVVLAVDLGG